MDRDVPLVVPEVNADALHHTSRKASLPIPTAPPPSWWSPSSRCMTPPRSKRVVVSTYQSVSGAGKEAMGRIVPPDPRRVRGRSGRSGEIPKQIAFNVIPHIDVSWIPASPRKNGR